MSTTQALGILPANSSMLLVDGDLSMYWIKSQDVSKVWSFIEQQVLATLRYDDVLTLPEIQASLLNADSQLFLVTEKNEFHSLAIAALFRDGFGDRFCRIISLAGRDLLNQHLFQRCIEEWARGNGCKRITAEVSEAGSRLFKRFGFNVRHVEIAKEL